MIAKTLKKSIEKQIWNPLESSPDMSLSFSTILKEAQAFEITFPLIFESLYYCVHVALQNFLQDIQGEYEKVVGEYIEI